MRALEHLGAVVVVVVLLLAGLATNARADDAPAEDARAVELKRRGDAAMDAGRPAEALAAYSAASSVAPTPALDYNIGRACLGVGDFTGAIDAFERFDAHASEALRARTPKLPEILGELRRKVAYITVRCDVDGARVSIDAVLAGATPLAPRLRANPGPRTIAVDAPGRVPFRTTLTLASGEEHRLDVVMTPIPKTGVLRLDTSPLGARVRVDSRGQVLAPMELTLAAGQHRVEVSERGYDTRRFSLRVGPDQTVEQRVVLERQKSIFERPWFWIGAGVAIAAGTVATILALSVERAPNEGSLGTYHVP